MKTKLSVALAALVVAAPLALAPADAQVVTRTTTTVSHGYHHPGRRVCQTVYRNHRRITRCVYR